MGLKKFANCVTHENPPFLKSAIIMVYYWYHVIYLNLHVDYPFMFFILVKCSYISNTHDFKVYTYICFPWSTYSSSDCQSHHPWLMTLNWFSKCLVPNLMISLSYLGYIITCPLKINWLSMCEIIRNVPTCRTCSFLHIDYLQYMLLLYYLIFSI